jgi:probable F420-dependent oxidoreductase
VKVRIGVGPGPSGVEELSAQVDQLEERRIDSLWLSEVVTGPQVEPVVGLAWALARTTHLKVGTGVSVLPGRHPVLVAKQLASLAALAPRRVLPVFGLQPARAHERAFFPVPGPRGEVLDEALPLIRRLLTEPRVTHEGRFFRIEDAGVGPLPPRPLDLWLGGSAPAGLRRVGRCADGWLGSFLSPAQAAAAVTAIRQAADEAGREIEPDHFGMSLPVADGAAEEATLRALSARNPDADPADVVATSWGHARELVSRYVDAGVTKFVVRPDGRPPSWERWLDEFAAGLVPLQT